MPPFSIISAVLAISIISLQWIFSYLKVLPCEIKAILTELAKIVCCKNSCCTNMWSLNKETCCHSLIKHPADHATTQPWPSQGEAPSALYENKSWEETKHFHRWDKNNQMGDLCFVMTEHDIMEGNKKLA